MTTESARERLARLMDERRRELGKTWDQVADEAGLTKEGLRGIRRGEGATIRPLSKAGIERALRWTPGSVEDILAGGDPGIVASGSARISGTPHLAAVGQPGEEDEFDRLDRLMEEWRRTRRRDSTIDRLRARAMVELLRQERDAG